MVFSVSYRYPTHLYLALLDYKCRALARSASHHLHNHMLSHIVSHHRIAVASIDTEPRWAASGYISWPVDSAVVTSSRVSRCDVTCHTVTSADCGTDHPWAESSTTVDLICPCVSYCASQFCVFFFQPWSNKCRLITSVEWLEARSLIACQRDKERGQCEATWLDGE